MEQRVSKITLGVADLKRSREFYERLGWREAQLCSTVITACIAGITRSDL